MRTFPEIQCSKIKRRWQVISGSGAIKPHSITNICMYWTIGSIFLYKKGWIFFQFSLPILVRNNLTDSSAQQKKKLSCGSFLSCGILCAKTRYTFYLMTRKLLCSKLCSVPCAIAHRWKQTYKWTLLKMKIVWSDAIAVLFPHQLDKIACEATISSLK